MLSYEPQLKAPMQTCNLIASTIAACALASTDVHADYVSPADWTASMTATTPAGTTAIDNLSASSIKMTYWFNTTGVYNGAFATFSTTATQNGPLTLNWSYQFWHEWAATSASLTFFANSASGLVENTVYSATPAYQGTFVSGSTTLNLSQGYSWGLRVGGSNYDSTASLSGIATLSQLPSPGALALLCAAGLLGNRRRRG